MEIYSNELRYTLMYYNESNDQISRKRKVEQFIIFFLSLPQLSWLSLLLEQWLLYGFCLQDLSCGSP